MSKENPIKKILVLDFDDSFVKGNTEDGFKKFTKSVKLEEKGQQIGKEGFAFYTDILDPGKRSANIGAFVKAFSPIIEKGIIPKLIDILRDNSIALVFATNNAFPEIIQATLVTLSADIPEGALREKLLKTPIFFSNKHKLGEEALITNANWHVVPSYGGEGVIHKSGHLQAIITHFDFSSTPWRNILLIEDDQQAYALQSAGICQVILVDGQKKYLDEIGKFLTAPVITVEDKEEDKKPQIVFSGSRPPSVQPTPEGTPLLRSMEPGDSFSLAPLPFLALEPAGGRASRTPSPAVPSRRLRLSSVASAAIVPQPDEDKESKENKNEGEDVVVGKRSHAQSPLSSPRTIPRPSVPEQGWRKREDARQKDKEKTENENIDL